MASSASASIPVRLRDTASKRADGTWDFDVIFNRELYPAVKGLRSVLAVSNLFQPVELTGSSNAIVPSYHHKNLVVSDAMPTLLTLSESDSTSFADGSIILLTQSGAGQVEVVPGGAVIVRTAQTLKLRGQYSTAFLVKLDTLEWVMFGDIEEVPVNVALLIQDRFIGGAQSVSGNNTDANIGQLQWNTAFASNAGTVARVAAQAGHPGIVRVSGHATLGGHQAMYLGHAAANGSVVALDEIDYVEFLVRNVGTGRFRFGIGNDAAAAGLGTNTMGFSADTDVTAVWYAFTNNSGSSTVVNTTVASAAGPWLKFRIQIVSTAEVRFYIDDVLVATITTNIPSFASLMAPAVQAITITPGPFQGIGEIDLFTMQMKTA